MLKPYPDNLPWVKRARLIQIGAIVTDSNGVKYTVNQRLISNVRGAEPRLDITPNV